MRCKGRASRTFTVGVGLQGQAQGDWPPTSNGGCRQVGVGACGTGCIPGLPPKTLEFRQPGVPLCSGDSAISLDGVLPVAHPPLPRWSASPPPPPPHPPAPTLSALPSHLPPPTSALGHLAGGRPSFPGQMRLGVCVWTLAMLRALVGVCSLRVVCHSGCMSRAHTVSHRRATWL